MKPSQSIRVSEFAFALISVRDSQLFSQAKSSAATTGLIPALFPGGLFFVQDVTYYGSKRVLRTY